MSIRVFKGFKDDSSSQYLKKQINKETINISPDLSNISNCFRFQFCSTLNIERYNTLQKLQTFYNDKIYRDDNSANYYFNGEMNQGNFLRSDISDSGVIVRQLFTDNDNNMNLTLTTSTAIDVSNENLFYIDPSGSIFDTGCNNLFFIQNSNIQYNIQDISGIVPEFKIYNEQNLCKL
tara:strand:- start:540 stop:1073 length:534 start_codon:yes stop_codon:yes gene_type:complete